MQDDRTTLQLGFGSHRGHDFVDERRGVGGCAVPRIQPRFHRRCDDVGGARHWLQPADGGHRTVVRTQSPPCRQHRRGRRHHRVVAVTGPGGARVVALSGDSETPSPVRDNLRADTDGRVRIGAVEQPALFDVKFDEGADVRHAVRFAADPGRIEADPAGGVDERDSVAIVQPAHLIGLCGAGHQSRAQTRQPEAAALFLGETHQRHRLLG